MRGTNSGVPRAASRIGSGALVAAVIGSGVLGLAGAADAAAPTATITFTAQGINAGSGKSITIKPGTDVVFVNKIDPTQSVVLLGNVTGLLRSVSVTVSGATQRAFTVGRNEQRTVSGYNSGSKPFVITYHVAYEATNVLQQTSDVKDDQGTITVAATPPQSPSPTTDPSPTGTPPQAPTQAPTGAPSAGSGTPSQGASDPGSSDQAGGEPTVPSYTLPPPDVASQVVPHGSGGSYRTGGGSAGGANSGSGSANGQPADGRLPAAAGNSNQATGTGTTTDTTTNGSDGAAGQQGAFDPAGDSTQERPLDTTAAASPAGALPFRINWPAIAALALLSTVAGALVRTYVAHRHLG